MNPNYLEIIYGKIKEKGAILIKTKVHYPYIYFLIEPTIVFVYRIETQKYMTVSELIDGSKFEPFKMDYFEDFETFDHNERQPAEGISFFLNHEDIGNMASEINIHIQRNRQIEEDKNYSRTVHIVTSESAAGSLRAGIERPKTVIGFPDAFSIGPLWNLADKTGQNFRRDWLFGHINYEQEDTEYENKFRNTLLQIEDIANHVPIYIWFGDNAEEQTGLRFYLYLLREKTNPIFLMNTTQLYEKNRTVEVESAYFHTGLLDSKKLKLFLEENKEGEVLTEEKRNQYIEEWDSLSEMKEVLRVWINGQIKTAPEDHYDPLIIETLKKLHKEQGSKDFIRTGKVIGEIVAEMDEFIDYFFLEYRIRYLLYNGALEIKGVPKSMRHYRIKLR